MRDVRKLTVTGNGKTYYITIPLWMIKQLKWRKGQKVSINLEGSRIVITDWKGK
jgi:antitoxin component of MazEF toxin-antitoxin module